MSATELREAARQLHNLTLGDPEVIIRAPSAEKRDAVAKAGQRLRDAVAGFSEASSRLEWLDADMRKNDDGVGIEYRDGQFCYPYLVNAVGGFGAGVGEAYFKTLAEAIDSARSLETSK